MNNTQHKPLDRQSAGKLASTVNRLRELNQQAIENPESEAERTGLVTYLSTGLLQHAAELLNAWFAVADEYEPLIRCYASLQQRSANFIKIREAFIAAQQQPQGESEGKPSNIIAPPGFNKDEAKQS